MRFKIYRFLAKYGLLRHKYVTKKILMGDPGNWFYFAEKYLKLFFIEKKIFSVSMQMHATPQISYKKWKKKASEIRYFYE